MTLQVTNAKKITVSVSYCPISHHQPPSPNKMTKKTLTTETIVEPVIDKYVNHKLPSNKMTNGQPYPGSKSRPTKATVF